MSYRAKKKEEGILLLALNNLKLRNIIEIVKNDTLRTQIYTSF